MVGVVSTPFLTLQNRMTTLISLSIVEQEGQNYDYEDFVKIRSYYWPQNL